MWCAFTAVAPLCSPIFLLPSQHFQRRHCYELCVLVVVVVGDLKHSEIQQQEDPLCHDLQPQRLQALRVGTHAGLRPPSKSITKPTKKRFSANALTPAGAPSVLPQFVSIIAP